MRGNQARSATMHSLFGKVEMMTRLSRLPLHHLGLLLMTSRVDGGTYPGGWLTRTLRVNDKPDKVL
jgi:hypothetical protein